MKKAAIICAGSIRDYDYIASCISDADYVICADAGILHAERLGVKPDMWVGDFDSFESCGRPLPECAKYARKIDLPCEKDDTDTEHCLTVAAENGCTHAVIVAASGTRLDHTVANMLLLRRFALFGIDAYMVNENNRVHYLGGGTLKLNRDSRFNYVSVIALDAEISGVTLHGFKYPLGMAKICRGSSLGISNEIIGDCATVCIEHGEALIIESCD